jgi:hypothetical protein
MILTGADAGPVRNFVTLFTPGQSYVNIAWEPIEIHHGSDGTADVSQIGASIDPTQTLPHLQERHPQ